MGRLFGWVDGILDRICSVIGAFILFQLPLFMHQYTLILKGHVDELSYYLGLIKQAAARSDKNIMEYIQKFLQSSDSDFARQGEIMQQLHGRLNEMNQALNTLQNANIWELPFVFITHFRQDIGQATWSVFQPGISFTVESLVYALIGIGFGYAAYHITTFPFRWFKTRLAR